jgi:endonuclease III
VLAPDGGGQAMKNSARHADRIRKLYRRLKRDSAKVQPVCCEEPVEALVYAIISENTTETSAQNISRKFSEHFTDLNDLRVTSAEEIVDLLGEDTAAARDIATRLPKVLMTIFNQHHKISLQAIKKIGKRPARQALEKIEGVSGFAVDYCMLTSLQAHAIPLTPTMVDYLRTRGLVYPNADKDDIQGFLTRQTAAKDAYEFYSLLRRESEVQMATKKKTAKSSKAG